MQLFKIKILVKMKYNKKNKINNGKLCMYEYKKYKTKLYKYQ